MTRTKESGSDILEEKPFELEGRQVCLNFPQLRKCITYLTGTKQAIFHPDTTPTVNSPCSLETE